MKRKQIKLTKSTGSVFRDLGFSPEESEHLRTRSRLMLSIRAIIQKRKLTQARAAVLFGVSQPRISDLVRGHIGEFSIDSLVNMLAHAKMTVEITVKSAA